MLLFYWLVYFLIHTSLVIDSFFHSSCVYFPFLCHSALTEVWWDSCAPSNDLESSLPRHRSSQSIAPFETHSCYFYAPVGKRYCGCHFVDLFYQQFHPYPQCSNCSRLTLGEVSHIY